MAAVCSGYMWDPRDDHRRGLVQKDLCGALQADNMERCTMDIDNAIVLHLNIFH